MTDRPLVAVLGGGQLGRMLALAGHNLGVRVRCLDTEPDACAGQVADLVVGDFRDPDALARLTHGADAVTYEFENVPVDAAEWCAQRLPTHPAPAALAAAQDRIEEKALLAAHGLKVGPHRLVTTREALEAAAAPAGEIPEGVGLPAVLKTCRGGYDGKGQFVLREAADIAPAWAALGDRPAKPSSEPTPPRLVLEAFVDFSREISLLAVRGSGETRFYEPVHNEHERGILARSSPAGPLASPEALRRARAGIASLMDALDYRGVLAVELFELPDGRLLASEMAPRVHNSGHWTIDAAACSQFENHLRAVLDWPLGSTATICPWEMRNLLGRVPSPQEVLATPGVRLHAYGKAEKAGRKVGHVTVVGAGA